jgi:hypothetical protein
MSDQNAGTPLEGGNVNPLHEDFINSAPEELRDAAAELAPVWDQYVQGKFTEAAEFRKQYEPFGDYLQNLTPEDLQDYLDFKELAADPQQLYAWHQSWDEALRKEHPELFDSAGQYDAGASQQAAVPPEVMQELTEMREWRAQQEASAQEAQVNSFIQSELDTIRQSNPNLSDQDVDDICALAARYVPAEGEPPQDLIQRGFKDFQNLVGRTEREFFDKKSHQPSQAQRGGRPNTAVTPVTSFEGASEAARRLIIESMKS